MSEWVVGWIGAVLAMVLLLTSTLNLALRLPSRVRLVERLRKLGREDRLGHLIEHQADLQLATAILRTACSLAIVMVSLWLCQRSSLPGAAWQNGTAFLTSMVVVLVFGVAIPGAWSEYAGESLLSAVLPWLFGLRWLLSPVVAFLNLFDELVRRLTGTPPEDAQTRADELDREILSVVSEGEAHGAVDEEEKEMIESVIDLRDTQVGQIMTPRTEIQAVEKKASLEDIKELIVQRGHSRIPVYEGTIDNILGVLYAKDLLRLDEAGTFNAASVMRSALFIPETKLLRDLLHEFQEKKVHIAIVLDEYGGTAGLVTIEDILEELVGEISDEYESDGPRPLRRIDVRLPEDEDYDTIGGFVFSSLGRIPAVGEKCRHDNLLIQVTAAENRRIKRLRLHIEPTGERSEPGD